MYLPSLISVVAKLKELAIEWKDIPMLARTHGQPASPTRLGKEILVYVERLEEQMRLLFNVPFAAKFGGATGNYNAHHVAFPTTDWKQFGTEFVETILGLHHSFPTTQIEHYDHFAAFFDALKESIPSSLIWTEIFGPMFQWIISNKKSKQVRLDLRRCHIK